VDICDDRLDREHGGGALEGARRPIQAKLNLTSSGNGTSHHLSGELFKIMTGVNMAHAPYRAGTPVLTDLLGGQVEVFFAAMASSSAAAHADLSNSDRRDSLILPDVEP
jgi:tripartite-type tricarboxylate transporter receptor subunit TctC